MSLRRIHLTGADVCNLVAEGVRAAAPDARVDGAAVDVTITVGSNGRLIYGVVTIGPSDEVRADAEERKAEALARGERWR